MLHFIGMAITWFILYKLLCGLHNNIIRDVVAEVNKKTPGH